MNLKIVSATWSLKDANAYVDFRIKLDCENARGYMPRIGEGEIIEGEFHELFENINNGRVLFSLSNSDYSGFTQFTPVGKDISRLDYLFVLPKSRKQGLGTKLVQRAIHEVRSFGCSELYLENSPSSRKFYENLGFQRYIEGLDEMFLKLNEVMQVA